MIAPAVGHALASALAVAVVIATPAGAQVQLQQQAQGRAQDEGPPPLPVHAWITFTQSVGSGTFVLSPNNPTTSTTLSLTPMIMHEGWQILLNQSFGIEWTQSDVTTRTNQVEMSDLALVVRNMRLLNIAPANLNVWPSLGYVAPISMASRNNGSLGTFTAGARANFSGLSDYGLTLFGGVNGGYTMLVPSLASRFAGRPAPPLQDRHAGPISVVSCNVRNPQELNNYACNDGALPSVANWGASLGLWWFYLLDGALGLTFNVGYGQSFSVRPGPDDQYTSEYARTGIVPRQSSSGDISIVYTPVAWLNLTLGASSGQPFLTADGKGARFPLWDFVSPYNNFSQLHFDATFSL